MTKHYCDLCGAEAMDVNAMPVAANIPAPYVVINKDKPCNVRATVLFSFVDHPSGFGGPPDLCSKCRDGLIEALKPKKKPRCEQPANNTSLTHTKL